MPESLLCSQCLLSNLRRIRQYFLGPEQAASTSPHPHHCDSCRPHSDTPSLLQRLPLELRLKIWDEIFPRQTVHLEWAFREWRANKCFARVSEQEGYESWKQSVVHLRPRAAVSRHAKCVAPTDDHKARLDVQLLRICRQFYMEILRTLYSKTIFAFHQAKDFVKFMKMCTELQRVAIRSVQIHCNPHKLHEGLQWIQQTDPAKLKRLEGLRNLYVTYPYCWGGNPGLATIWRRWQILPLKNVTVTPETVRWMDHDGDELLRESLSLRAEILEQTSDEKLEDIEDAVQELMESLKDIALVPF